MFDASTLQELKLNIINVEYCELDSSWRYSNVYGPFHRLYLTSGGQGVVSHHGRKFILGPSVLHLVPGYTNSCYRCDSFLEQYYVHFACELEGHFDFFSEMPLSYQAQCMAGDVELFNRLIELNPGMGLKERDPRKYDKKLHLERSQGYADEVSPAVFLESKGIMLQLLSRFIDESAERVSEHKEFGRIERAIRFMRENIDSQLTVKELADLACLNADYFSRVFTRVMGTGPIEYVHRKRVQRIKLLLLTTDMSLEQIAGTVGFSSASYLLRIFKKYTGMTPKQYRKAAFYG
ncbi:MAG: helix-turn-helix transcriptional regulator [Anaerohalosphaera sp.]|nr:helix-turn-helix transcriptional regulator [Anaerohalosphaera sp.]